MTTPNGSVGSEVVLTCASLAQTSASERLHRRRLDALSNRKRLDRERADLPVRLSVGVRAHVLLGPGAPRRRARRSAKLNCSLDRSKPDTRPMTLTLERSPATRCKWSTTAAPRCRECLATAGAWSSSIRRRAAGLAALSSRSRAARPRRRACPSALRLCRRRRASPESRTAPCRPPPSAAALPPNPE
jgi:hypothetical protein